MFFFSLLSVMRFLVNYSVTSLFAFIKSQNYNKPQRTFLAIDGIRRLRTGRVTRRNETSVSFSQWYSMSYKWYLKVKDKVEKHKTFLLTKVLLWQYLSFFFLINIFLSKLYNVMTYHFSTMSLHFKKYF